MADLSSVHYSRIVNFSTFQSYVNLTVLVFIAELDYDKTAIVFLISSFNKQKNKIVRVCVLQDTGTAHPSGAPYFTRLVLLFVLFSFMVYDFFSSVLFLVIPVLFVTCLQIYPVTRNGDVSCDTLRKNNACSVYLYVCPQRSPGDNLRTDKCRKLCTIV